MTIRIKIAKAHQVQLEDAEIQREITSVDEELNKVELSFKDNTINFVFIKGIYLHSERKMLTACLFVNKMDKPVTDIHGVLRMNFQHKNAMIAKTIINFDRPFIGLLNPDEALLVHIGIPVKGMSEDESFTITDIEGSFTEVRITTE